MQRINELGLAQRVIITGYLPDADLPALLAGATAFVFPSLYEGFGMPVLEAMAAGIPVLTSNSSALPEVAGDAALLVDPLDTQAIAAGLMRLAHDADLRALLRERGLARAALCTWDRCADQTLQVLIG
jgi:glycosyltransferase involved in cell wall biosynthesis